VDVTADDWVAPDHHPIARQGLYRSVAVDVMGCAASREQQPAAHPHVGVGGEVVQRGTCGEEICAVLAANPRLEIVPFPGVAPELNPQEQVWKATREAVPHNHTDLQLSTLARRFKAHLTHTTFPVSFLEHRGC
jgi:hypothetical protein